jgi:hypothetical protein
MTADAAIPTASAWFDSTDLARRFRVARRREAGVLVGVGVFLAILAVTFASVRARVENDATAAVTLVLFALAALFLLLGRRGMAQSHYLSGVKVDDEGVHMRFLDGEEAVAGWTGMRVEFVFLDLPPNPVLGKDAAAMAAQWMLWVEGKAIGDVSAAAVDAVATRARSRALSVEETEGPWREFRSARIVRIGAR